MIRCAMVAHLSEVSGAGVALLDTVRQLDPQRFDCTLVLPGAGLLGRPGAGPQTLDAGVLAASELPEVGLEPLYLRRPDAEVATRRKSTLTPQRSGLRRTR